MKITKTNSIQALFNILHDGNISSHKAVGKDLFLEVDIQYLAERIDPEYRKFKLSFWQLHRMEFEPWFDDQTRIEAPVVIAKNIFIPELEILSAEIEGSVVIVSCNQAEPGHGYCGGFLKIDVESVTVQDEGGASYTVTQLDTLCSEYWQEWSEKNA